MSMSYCMCKPMETARSLWRRHTCGGYTAKVGMKSRSTGKIEKMKNMNAKSPSKWASPNPPPLSTEAQKSNFHERKSSLLRRGTFRLLFRFWRLLGRLEKEKKREDERKRGKWENNKKKKTERGKTKKNEKMFAVFLHCTAVLNCVRATHGLPADRAPVYRGCPCRDPLGCPLISRQNGIRDKAPPLWLLL